VLKKEYEFIQGVVKGLSFFGTPFRGSGNADILSPLVSIASGIAKVSASFVNEMKSFSPNLPYLVDNFNQVAMDNKIEIIPFIEKKTDGLSKVVSD
jgi:hypothetical protein